MQTLRIISGGPFTKIIFLFESSTFYEISPSETFSIDSIFSIPPDKSNTFSSLIE